MDQIIVYLSNNDVANLKKTCGAIREHIENSNRQKVMHRLTQIFERHRNCSLRNCNRFIATVRRDGNETDSAYLIGKYQLFHRRSHPDCFLKNCFKRCTKSFSIFMDKFDTFGISFEVLKTYKCSVLHYNIRKKNLSRINDACLPVPLVLLPSLFENTTCFSALCEGKNILQLAMHHGAWNIVNFLYRMESNFWPYNNN